MRAIAFAAAMCAMAAAGAVRSFTAPSEVAETIAGEDSVEITGQYGKFAVMSGANTYSGGTTIKSGGVTVAHPDALGTGRIVCHDRAMIKVAVSYKKLGRTLNEAIIDRIDAVSKDDGSEPCISLQFTAEALDNDVDLTGRPYIWLGGSIDKWPKFTGKITPWNNQYRFGYVGPEMQQNWGISYESLGDAEDGTPRSVLVRGAATVFLRGVSTFTGDIDVGSGGNLWCYESDNLAAAAVPRRKVILRDNSKLLVGHAGKTFRPNVDFEIDGAVTLHSCGAAGEVCTVFNGNFSGDGSIILTDQGGVRFCGAENTYAGSVNVANGQTKYIVEIGIGDGANCSWAGSAITQREGFTNQIVRIRNNGEATIATDFGTAGGRLEKHGPGTLNLGKPFVRKSILPELPVMDVRDGKVKLLAEQPDAEGAGSVRISNVAELDLGDLAHGSVWLPYGGGAISGVAEGGVKLKGAPDDKGRFFSGSADGAVTVDVLGGEWKIARGARVAGKLGVEAGTVSASATVYSRGAEIAEGARLRIDAAEKLQGLKATWWMDAKMPSGATDVERLEKLMKECVVKRPDGYGDMRHFGAAFKSDAEPNDKQEKSAFAHMMGGTADGFAMLFEGFLETPVAGDHAFQVEADDFVLVTVGGRVAAVRGPTTNQAQANTIHLEAGRHPVRIIFFEGTGWEILRLRCKFPGDANAGFVPMERLGTAGPGEVEALGEVSGAGTLELAGGETAVAGGGDGIAAKLHATGEARLANTEEGAAAAALHSPIWRFGEGAKLELAGNFAPPAGAVAVEIEGEEHGTPRVLADLTAAGAAADGFRFVEGAGFPRGVKLDWSGRVLRLCDASGTLIVIR